MIVEIPGFDFRIKGSDTDWQVQYRQRRGEGGESWNGKYFFPSLEHAVGKCYELALRESPAQVDVEGALAECRKVKDSLLRAVRKAVAL